MEDCKYMIEMVNKVIFVTDDDIQDIEVTIVRRDNG